MDEENNEASSDQQNENPILSEDVYKVFRELAERVNELKKLKKELSKQGKSKGSSDEPEK